MSTGAAARPRAEIVVTGDEVLLGRIQERNAAHLASWLDAAGLDVLRTQVVSDNEATIRDAVTSALVRADLVVTSGGLGPTHDDRTMAAVAAALRLELVVSEEAAALVEAAQRLRVGRGAEAAVRKQAEVPAGAQVLPPIGTAPGCLARSPEGRLVVVLPGPPWELREMWLGAIATPSLAALLAAAPRRSRRVLRVVGVGESELMAVRARLPEDAVAAPHGIYTKPGELEVVIDLDAGGRPDALADGLAAGLPGRVYATDGQRVEDIVADALRRRGERLAVAESCTGGGLGALITAAAGASEWFLGGVIAYDNAVKVRVLGVPESVLSHDGAVSEACARAMAEGVRERLGAEWSLSITGIAGPGGGSPQKPVGTVVIGLAGPGGVEAWTLRLPGDREGIRQRAAAAALHRLREALSIAS